MTKREQKAREALQDIANEISARLPNNMGFCLLAYEFGKTKKESQEKKLIYVSNSKREDVLKAMMEFVDKNIKDKKMFGKDV